VDFTFSQARHQPLAGIENPPGDQVNAGNNGGKYSHAEKIAANLIGQQQDSRDRSRTGEQRYGERKDRDIFSRRSLLVALGCLQAGPLAVMPSVNRRTP